MKNLFTIGQFAKLCETTTDTLIHYENIGLLKASHITTTNRHLYDIGLLHTYHIIHTLSETGIPLLDIKTLLQSDSETVILAALKEREIHLQQQLNNLHNMYNYFNHLSDSASSPTNPVYGQPFIQTQFEPLLLFATLLGYEPITPAEIISSVCSHKNECLNLNIYPFSIGLILQRKSLLVQNDRRMLLYTPFPTGIATNKTPVQPAGEYAVILHKGSFDSINDSIELLYDFIEYNHWLVASDTYINVYHNSLPGNRDSFFLIKIRFLKS